MQYVMDLVEVGQADIARVGGKNASSGEMIRELAAAGVRVPTGFATTAEAYLTFLARAGLSEPIRDWIGKYGSGRASLADCGRAIRELILGARLPDDLAREIGEAYRRLSDEAGGPDIAVAVRSSATAEDLPDASFAGQQESFLNVRGVGPLLDACRRCYASLFTDRAISYREAKGYGHLDVALSVGIQRMVRSGKAGSGVMFSIDPETGFPRVVVISAAWGLGETVVQGSVDPDTYMVFKPTLGEGYAPIVEKRLGSKEIKLTDATGGSRRTRLVATTTSERQRFVLDDFDILELTRSAMAIERHYGRPMDMEWAKDAVTGELFIVQARPETVQARLSAAGLVLYRLQKPGRKLLTGAAIGSAIASGEVCVIRDPSDIGAFRDGAVLVAETTDPDWVPIMKRAVGIVTDHGGVTSHAAIVSRELGVPAVVGTGRATVELQDRQSVTLSCAQGEEGAIFDGHVPFERQEVDLSTVPSTRTRLMVNLAEPSGAFRWWKLPARGVGLARMEFIISNLIRVHPMALLNPDKVREPDRRSISRLVRGYAKPSDYFVEQLARGIGKLAATFHPHPIIVRTSDFKTNEYARLIGGEPFEPHEENPMLGFRGASRYYDDRYRPAFELECQALKRAREELGFSNIVVMIPFCRTPAEADRVLAVMANAGLRRGEYGLKVYMMCEIPSNVISAGAFANRFDGFSIGSNDLTQLVLGVDRDSEQLASLFDERDEAVVAMIEQAIGKAHEHGIPIGICGQAPSNYPDFAVFLVDQEIDSISLNPDSFLKTVGIVAEAEARHARPERPDAKDIYDSRDEGDSSNKTSPPRRVSTVAGAGSQSV